MAISSLVVETVPESTLDAKDALEAMAGVEIHEVHGHKLVVTIEAPSAGESHAIASSFIGVSGVTGVNLVYLNIEDDIEE